MGTSGISGTVFRAVGAVHGVSVSQLSKFVTEPDLRPIWDESCVHYQLVQDLSAQEPGCDIVYTQSKGYVLRTLIALLLIQSFILRWGPIATRDFVNVRNRQHNKTTDEYWSSGVATEHESMPPTKDFVRAQTLPSGLIHKLCLSICNSLQILFPPS